MFLSEWFEVRHVDTDALYAFHIDMYGARARLTDSERALLSDGALVLYRVRTTPLRSNRGLLRISEPVDVQERSAS